MRPRHLILPFLAFATGLYACMEPGSPDATGPTAPGTVRADAPAAGCDLKDVEADARDFFLSNSDRKAAQELIRQMGKDCTDEAGYGAVADSAWQVLALMETALESGAAGPTEVGASLANGLIDCIEDEEHPFCEPTGVPLELEDALAPQGTFAVREGDSMMPAVARDAVPFEFRGGSNAALWGVELVSTEDPPAPTSWFIATGASSVLVYGNPPTEGRSGSAPLLADALRYDFHTFPEKTRLVGRDFNGDLHVGACFQSEIDPNSLDGTTRDGVVERHNGGLTVLLEKWEPGFCDDVTFASLEGSGDPSRVQSLLAAAGHLFTPSPLMAAEYFIGVPAVGGTPFDFSTFSGVGADVDADLDVWVHLPGGDWVQLAGHQFEDALAGEVIADSIRVTATSGDGTLMERVLVSLSIQANQGEPAGGTFVSVGGEEPELTGYTDEADGTVILGPVALGKAGGYVLCVSGAYEPFTFPTICSDGSHIDNPNGNGGG